jgi:hypothetical protein
MRKLLNCRSHTANPHAWLRWLLAVTLSLPLWFSGVVAAQTSATALSAARAAIERQQFDVATTVLRQAQVLHPQDEPVQFLLARVLAWG